MALITAVAGPYTTTYSPGAGATGAGAGALAQGITADDGFTLRWTIHKQRIGNDGTDQYGQSLLESIYRGADWMLNYLCREYSINNTNAAWPYGRVAAVALSPQMGVIGRADDQQSISGAVVMTAVTGTPAATNPATLTAAHAIAQDGIQYALSFTSKIRETPVHLKLYPYDSSGNKIWFATT